MSIVDLRFLFEDPEYLNESNLPNYGSLDFVSNGSHIYGEIMWPSADFDKPHPCVIMLHGYVEDAYNLALYAHSEDFAKKYDVDINNIFLLGHSMGGNSALNAGKKLDFLRGIIMLAPYDPTVLLSGSKETYLESLLNEGKILQSDGLDAIYDDIVANQDSLKFENSFERVKDKNLLILAAKYDSVSINEKMIAPLWKKLSERRSLGNQRLIEYPAEHGLLGRRISVIRDIAYFLKGCLV